ncbi:MAG: hypothetical protein ABFD81_17835 [Syntrophaceae bacterium]
MRSLYLTALAILVMFSPLAGQEQLKQSDELFIKAYYSGGSQTHKAALDLTMKAIEAGDQSYDAYWRAARGCRSYAEEIKRENLTNETVWKPICVRYGRMGMQYGDKAVKLNPQRVEGWLYYGLSVGNYADGVSMFTAVKEGLVGKTRQSFEKAYAIDKTFMWGAPMTALGRMWNILPWPLKDNKKALKYLREAQRLVPDNPEGQVYLGLVLLESGDDKDTAEAKALLLKATKGKIQYFADWAKRELAKVN